MADNDSLADRLELACAHRKMSQSSLSRALGVSSAAITSMKYGQRPAHELLKKSAKILGVSEDWLRDGTGPSPLWAVPRPDAVHVGGQEAAVPEQVPAGILAQLLQQMDALKSQLADVSRRITTPPTFRKIHCTACGKSHYFQGVQPNDAPVVSACPHCRTLLVEDVEATSGWRALKSADDQARTAAQPPQPGL